MPAFRDLTGQRFNRLTVLREGGRTGSGMRKWVCVCTCENLTIVVGAALASGHTKSCGCLNIESRRRANAHGMYGTSTYHSWGNMKSRCDDTSNKSYGDYGARGIAYCKRWSLFENFYEDMGTKPEGLSLDRKNNNKGYSKGNCRWATRRQQNTNKRNNVVLTMEGKTLCMAEWAKKIKVPYGTLYYRHQQGLSTEDILRVT